MTHVLLGMSHDGLRGNMRSQPQQVNWVTRWVNWVTRGVNRATRGVNRVTRGVNRVTRGVNRVTRGVGAGGGKDAGSPGHVLLKPSSSRLQVKQVVNYTGLGKSGCQLLYGKLLRYTKIRFMK